MVEHVHEALWGEVDIEGEMDESRVHDNGKSTFALLNYRFGEHMLIITDKGVIAILKESLVFFGCRGVTECRSADDKDAVEI